MRATPIAIVARERLESWLRLARAGEGAPDASAGPDARAVEAWLAARGASFFGDIAAGTALDRGRTEEALAELVSAGRATSDSFAGLRALLVPSSKRALAQRLSRRSGAGLPSMDAAGRWTLLAPERAATSDGAPPIERSIGQRGGDDPAVEHAARVYLRRYGVVFRKLLERESLAPPWRELARALRRMEGRGEIRGGRFVQLFSGEQFALPEAIGALRSARRAAPTGALVTVCGVDPLNLVGVITPGPRIAAVRTNRVVLRDGEPIAVREAGDLRALVPLEPDAHDAVERALARGGRGSTPRTVPARP